MVTPFMSSVDINQEGFEICAKKPPIESLAPVNWSLSGRADPDSAVQEVHISSKRFTIGRRSENNLCLANPTVSGDHAELWVVDEALFLKDLGSTNGTFLNGHRVKDPRRVQNGDTLQFGTARFQVRRSTDCDSGLTVQTDVASEALAYLQFEKLLQDPAVVPYFQPIVRLTDSCLVGYEVLARSRLIGLQMAATMFRLAVELDSESELSRLMRREGVRVGEALVAQTPKALYLNTHPSELDDPQLLKSLQELRQEFPDLCLILEIHEAAVTSSPFLARLRKQLDALDIGLAYDDFGAGQARFLELVDVPPDVIKFDIHLIRGLPEASAERRRMVQSLVQIARDLNVNPLAEGIETAEEAAVCDELGFDLAQGYYFGEPAPARTWLKAKGAQAQSES